MKKLLLFVIPMMLVGCAPEASPALPPVEGTTYNVKLDSTNCGLTHDDSTAPVSVELASSEDQSVKYQFEIGAPCYIHSEHPEFIVKNGGYVKSKSTFTVKRLIVDFFSSKGVNFNVYNSSESGATPLEYHESTIAPVDPNDGGCVYEYEINSNFWTIKNESNYKPGFYSVTVVFEK